MSTAGSQANAGPIGTIAGLGALVIGGFYWKRGTTAGAFAALALGAIIPTVYLLFKVEGTMTAYYGVTVALPGAMVLVAAMARLAGILPTGTRGGALRAGAGGAGPGDPRSSASP